MLLHLHERSPCIRNVSNSRKQRFPWIYIKFAVTDQGIYSIYHVGLVVLGPLVANRLLVGDFQGLEVLEPYCEDPMILTTEKISGLIVVNMVGESHYVGYIERNTVQLSSSLSLAILSHT